MRTAIIVPYRLKVRRVEAACIFELSWGSNQQLSAVLPYPESLASAYQQWRTAYLDFYRQLTITSLAQPLPAAPSPSDPSPPLSTHSPLPPASNPTQESLPPSQYPPHEKTDQNSLPPPPPLRGRAIDSGHINLAGNTDRQIRLAKTEATLLQNFHSWLRSSELYEIRTEIQRAAQTHARDTGDERLGVVDVFITCHPTELEYLPWEAWEIGNELATANCIRIARYPDQVRAEVMQPRKNRRNRLRVLAIMGDDTGLDFKADREAVKRLAPVADVEYLGYKPQDPGQDLKHQIAEALDDDRGWDVLFFAGHSLESDVMGGELSIAPGVRISIKELAPHLQRAREYGLQLAVFNSCSGLSIANATLDLGLTQVAIMREPIHNSVAQEFLVQLLKQLAAGQDSHDAVRNASQFLKLEKTLTYPSVHLVPSFFRHPDTQLFRVEKKSLKQKLSNLLPTPQQAIALATIALASLTPWVESTLLDERTYIQALYRDITQQVPDDQQPPVLLVHIDRESIFRSTMSDPVPMDRSYLASLLDQLRERSAPVIGIDYLLDRQQPSTDPTFAAALQNSVEEAASWVVLATISDQYPSVTARDIAPLEWTLRGNIIASHSHVKLPSMDGCNDRVCPFAYLLALSLSAYETVPPTQARPHTASTELLQSQLWDTTQSLAQEDSDPRQLTSLQTRGVAAVAQQVGLMWLRPLIDFSIPPDQAYERISAWQLLEDEIAPDIINQVVLIGAGGYADAGIEEADYFPLPNAMHYWRARGRGGVLETEGLDNAAVYTGAEAHAYAIHHLLNRHLIIPIPDLWMIALVALGGKYLTLWLEQQPKRGDSRKWAIWWLLFGSGSYALASLQVYVSVGVLLPVSLPLLTLWTYVFLSWRKTSRD